MNTTNIDQKYSGDAANGEVHQYSKVDINTNDIM